MALLTADELAEMHATYVDALPDTCTITNPVAPGASADVVADVLCAVIRPTQTSLDGAGASPLSRRVTYTITVPLETNVRTGAEISVSDGRTFRAGEITRPASYSHCLYIAVTEVVG